MWIHTHEIRHIASMSLVENPTSIRHFIQDEYIEIYNEQQPTRQCGGNRNVGRDGLSVCHCIRTRATLQNSALFAHVKTFKGSSGSRTLALRSEMEVYRPKMVRNAEATKRLVRCYNRST